MGKKVFVVGPQTGYARWIDELELVNKISDADIIFFTGGSDIDPATYNCKKHPSVWCSPHRDREELAVWSQVSPNQLVWGTCRGFQLINCLYGGILVQDCDNHWCDGHSITNGIDSYETTSLHHQMIYPWELDQSDYDILYWSTKKRSNKYEGDKIDPCKILLEPEVAVWHRRGMPICLGAQGHPEMMSIDSPFVRMLNNLLNKYLCIK